MQRNQYDVVIIGGGPAGSLAARSAAEGGVSVLVAEKDPDIGSPVRCAEAVSIRHMKEFLAVEPSFCRQAFTRAEIIAPDGTVVDVAELEHGYIVDRKIFDRRLAEEAVAAGADVFTCMDAVGAERNGDGDVTVHFRDGDLVRCRVVIAADGTESRAGRWLGVQTACRPDQMWTAAQYLLAGVDLDVDCLKLYFGQEIAPNGYLWVFAKGERLANFGVVVSNRATESASWYLDRARERMFPNSSILGRTQGGIGCTGGLKKMYADNLMIVGDAAILAEPMTAAGIPYAMTSGRMAGTVAAEAVKAGDVSERALKTYQKQWDKFMGSRQRKVPKIKAAAYDLSDEAFNKFARRLNTIPFEKRHPRKVVFEALKGNPELIPAVLRSLF